MVDGSYVGENLVMVLYYGVYSNGQGQDEKDVVDGGFIEFGGNLLFGGIVFDVFMNEVNWVSDGYQY